jgi:isopentenyldiphosphate isomerase
LIEEIGLYHEAATKAVKHVFSAEIVGGELSPPEDEILDIKWLTFDEVKIIEAEGKLRAPWVWDVIQNDRLASA